jgi:hypothetical protein
MTPQSAAVGDTWRVFIGFGVCSYHSGYTKHCACIKKYIVMYIGIEPTQFFWSKPCALVAWCWSLSRMCRESTAARRIV